MALIENDLPCKECITHDAKSAEFLPASFNGKYTSHEYTFQGKYVNTSYVLSY